MLDLEGTKVMALVLWIIAAILAIVGIVQLLQGQIIFGIVLIVARLPGRPWRLQHLQQPKGLT